MTYYTSDLHLGHENILKQRTMFSTVEEMNTFLIEKWNKKIKKNDEVYIVGDFSYRSKTPVQEYLQMLNGSKHLIIGNHDADWLKKISEEEKSRLLISTEHMKIIKTNKIKITLCHYPMLEWSGSRYASAGNSFLIHGHIHDAKNDIYNYIKDNQPTALNCGTDINGFEPVTLEELIKNNQEWYGRESTCINQ